MIYGSWVASAINSASNTTLTGEIDLGRVYDKFCIQTGVTNSTPTLKLKVSKTSGGTYSTLQAMDANTTASADWVTSATSANETFIGAMGPYRYVKILYGGAQTNSSVAYVCGYRD